VSGEAFTDRDMRDLRNGGDWASAVYDELPWKAADEIEGLRAELARHRALVEELAEWGYPHTSGVAYLLARHGFGGES